MSRTHQHKLKYNKLSIPLFKDACKYTNTGSTFMSIIDYQGNHQKSHNDVVIMFYSMMFMLGYSMMLICISIG